MCCFNFQNLTQLCNAALKNKYGVFLLARVQVFFDKNSTKKAFFFKNNLLFSEKRNFLAACLIKCSFNKTEYEIAIEFCLVSLKQLDQKSGHMAQKHIRNLY